MLRNRTFVVSLGISALLHLSMITVFSIGVWFKVTPTPYYEFRIVPETLARADPAPLSPDPIPEHQLRLPGLEDPLGLADEPDDSLETLKLTSTGGLEPPLPAVELPTILFSDLDRLSQRKLSLNVGARRAELLAEERQDSWSRFGKEIAQLREAMGRLPFFDQESGEESTGAPLVSVPAEGFEIRVEWMGDPTDRGLLFSPPIEALWRTDPDDLAEPITFMLRVGPDGRVREVIPVTVTDDTSLTVDIAKALTRYRFTPLEHETVDQRGTLVLSPAVQAP